MKKLLTTLGIIISLAGSAQTYTIREILVGAVTNDTFAFKVGSPDSIWRKSGGAYTFYYKPTSRRYLAFTSVVGLPTTLAGYGITDAAASGITVNGHALTSNVTVTAADLTLDNVTNTSDVNKPVSTAQQNALNLKAPLASPAFTGTPTGITSAHVGLGNVQNPSATPGNGSNYMFLLGNNAGGLYATRLINGNNLANGSVTLTASDLSLGNVDNTSDANKPVSTAQQNALNLKYAIADTPTGYAAYRAADIANAAAILLKANSASPTITGTLAAPIVTMSGKITNYNSIATVSNGVAALVATIDATTQAANIGAATLYAVPAAGFYRVSIYITITQAATTSSTMPSTTIAYTDGNSGTNAHSTTTTATAAGNSVTASFAQASYVLYAKASTNITYATASYASSGATPMQYALRIRVEAL